MTLSTASLADRVTPRHASEVNLRYLRAQEWPARPAAYVLGLALAIATACAHAQESGQHFPSRPDAPNEWRDDADLADVFFIDDQHGWAVGDLGTILHTTDGGGQWRVQQTPVSHRLRSVCFIDRDHGWAVGGYSHPFTHRSSGTVLRTNSGGQTWELIPGLLLPSLQHVRFDTNQSGWAAGNASALYPTGAYQTADGGRTWTSFPGGAGRHYAAAGFRNNAGVFVDRNGQVDTLRKGRVQNTATLPFRVLNPDAFSFLLAPNVGFVSDGGRPWLTIDGGDSWQRVGALPPNSERQFRFSSLAAVGSHCWLAGEPGSRVWRSTDNARTWSAFPTGETLPINALHFRDSQHGWAVGAFGTILATHDGGQTWQSQHGGGRRVAAMGVYARPADVPCELFASLSAAEDYRVHVALLTMGAPSSSDSGTAPLTQRLKDAMAPLAVSGDVLSRLSLPDEAVQFSAGQLAAHWDGEVGGSSLNQLTEQLVRSLRVWRPDVLVTSGEDASEDGTAQLVNRLVQDAVELAGDPKAYPDQHELAGLAPWKVSRIFVEIPDAEGNSAQATPVNSRQLALATGRVVANLSFDARALLSPEAGPTVETRWFRGLNAAQDVGTAGVESRQGIGLLHRLAIPYDSAARRKRAAPGNLGQLRQVAEQQRNIEAMLARVDQLTSGGAHLLEQASRLAESLDSHAAGGALYQLAVRIEHGGDLELAAEAHRRLLKDHPQHPFAEPSLVWLIRYESSAEIAWWKEHQNPPAVRLVSGELPDAAPTIRLSADSPPLSGGIDGQVTSASTREKPAGEHSRKTITLVNQLRSSQPALLAEPSIRFPLAAAYRSTGKIREAESIYRQYLTAEVESPWRDRAARELARAKPAAPREAEQDNVWRCAATDQPPYLDGLLDEEFWQAASPVELGGAETEATSSSATARIGRDAKHLYFAVRCQKVVGLDYPAGERPRPRDADLSSHDRIDLRLDINRDYASYWHLTVDHRGWTGESVLGDRSWNPQWYVASSNDDTSWTIEAAIPLSELCPQPPEPGEAWAVGLQRITPSHGVRSWSASRASTPQTRGFGMLVFE